VKKVLVTGGSGFIALHCIAELLKQNYSVRTSLRTMNRKNEIIKSLSKVVDINDNLEFCKLDLLKDDGWNEASKDCTYVLHVASPILTKDKNPDALIKPAVEGLMRALQSSIKNNVKRFVMTSSVAAIARGTIKEWYDETDWSDVNSKIINTYSISKTLAEKSLWDYVNSLNQDKRIEICTINPTFVIGKSLSNDIGASNLIIKKILDGSMPFLPKLNLGIVDVVDVAKMHIKAMTTNDANNKRFLLCSKNMWYNEIANLLNQNGFKAPRITAPNILIKLFSLFNPTVRPFVKSLGLEQKYKINQAKKILGWEPSNIENSILSIASQIKKLNK
tara:strand:- start:6379 stop:7377 length:999 start_codon:yes stop_codon:yes gene_type:complete